MTSPAYGQSPQPYNALGAYQSPAYGQSPIYTSTAGFASPMYRGTDYAPYQQSPGSVHSVSPGYSPTNLNANQSPTYQGVVS